MSNTNEVPQNTPVTVAGSARLAAGHPIPFIMPSSGTVGNNGALTLTTALPTTYATGAYVYMPAGALFTGSAAGWYFAQFTSTTVGTVYSNQYTSGTPTFIANPILLSATGPGAYTQQTGVIQSLALTILGNRLGPTGMLRVFSLWSLANNANTKTLQISYGGVQIMGAGPANAAAASYLSLLYNRGNSSQIGFLSSNNGTGSGTTANPYYSVNTTANQLLVVSFGITVATDFIVLEAIDDEFRYGY